jgi:hypothetical protein
METRFRAVPSAHLFTPATETGIAHSLPQFMRGADLVVAADKDNPLGYLRGRTQFFWALNGPALGATT